MYVTTPSDPCSKPIYNGMCINIHNIVRLSDLCAPYASNSRIHVPNFIFNADCFVTL